MSRGTSHINHGASGVCKGSRGRREPPEHPGFCPGVSLHGAGMPCVGRPSLWRRGQRPAVSGSSGSSEGTRHRPSTRPSTASLTPLKVCEEWTRMPGLQMTFQLVRLNTGPVLQLSDKVGRVHCEDPQRAEAPCDTGAHLRPHIGTLAF